MTEVLETRATPRTERLLLLVLALGFALAFVLVVISAWSMSLAADEAWIISSVQGLAETGVYAHQNALGATTTGGPYTTRSAC